MAVSANVSMTLEASGGLSARVSVVATVCASLLASVVIAGNLLVIVAFVKTENLRSVTNSFLVSLACADLLVGVVVVPFYISLSFVNRGEWYLGQWSCFLFYAMDVMASTASILHLCVVTADRYMAIVYPLTYPVRMTRKVAGVLMLLAWGLSLCVSFPWMFYWKAVVEESPGSGVRCPPPSPPLYSLVSITVAFFVPATVIIALYARMCQVARQHSRSVHKGRIQCGNDRGHPQEAMRIHLGRAQTQTELNREYRAAKTVGLVVGAFLVCWLPVFAVILVSSWCEEELKDIRSYINWLGFINSAVNPFIYAFAISQFREAFKRLLCFERRRSGARNGQNLNFRPGNRFFSGQASPPSATPPTGYQLKHIYF
ncbi:octopamine receptor Oamb-like [Acanthaster planci]|uniref:Octopamine receptor Oamb-like n=1 Tax=Acanthaster planci TaxID=133434 RepID=A0A8B7ZBQ0_ACAPL|nr:octopamine receptor Oamb-like [Acanthaster planci]